MRQIGNDYFYISIKIRALATFSHKVEKIVSKLHSGTASPTVNWHEENLTSGQQFA